ncbi:hypothetical protein [Derxia gummosa]|uniref:Uncharacterized protein n=1 Tax=Derxia gummosa DSM 723 TaxID=1121388 RepID=A0A8B6X7Z9_9BURK|nr:hypothetical protein [Derxia gummosa]
MTSFLLLGLGAVLAGSAGFYLASPHQRLRAAPLPARPARGAGTALLLLGLLALGQTMQAITAVFVFLTALMLALVLLPHAGALVARPRGRS